MKHGDYTRLAKLYIHRPGYSQTVLDTLASHVGARRGGFLFAEAGAGTGKLTAMLGAMGLSGFAIEPNGAMREEGIRLCSGLPGIRWLAGAAENTGLDDNSVDWAVMASSFHWTDAPSALREFHRILRPSGFLSLMWNPRDLARSPVEQAVEERIREIVPDLKRVSSGGRKYTEDLEDILCGSGLFHDLLFLEAPHTETMDKTRYLGVWQSVNDIQVQAGEERFRAILRAIEEVIADRDTVAVPYRTRAWTVRVAK